MQLQEQDQSNEININFKNPIYKIKNSQAEIKNKKQYDNNTKRLEKSVIENNKEDINGDRQQGQQSHQDINAEMSGLKLKGEKPRENKKKREKHLDQQKNELVLDDKSNNEIVLVNKKVKGKVESSFIPNEYTKQEVAAIQIGSDFPNSLRNNKNNDIPENDELSTFKNDKEKNLIALEVSNVVIKL